MASAGTTPDSRPPGPTVWTAAACLLLLGACQREGVRRYLVEKERAPVQEASMPAGSAAAPEPAVAQGGGLRWTLPRGWQEKQGGGEMRYATLTPPGGGKAEVTVIRLAGPAGGELANVNRWRNQLGLAPLAEADLAPARKPLRSPAGELAVYDFTSQGAKKLRTVAGFASIEGETWFLKLTGDAEEVASIRPAFLDLLGSLRREAR